MLQSRLFAAGCSPVVARTGTIGAAAASGATPPRAESAETIVRGEWGAAWHVEARRDPGLQSGSEPIGEIVAPGAANFTFGGPDDNVPYICADTAIRAAENPGQPAACVADRLLPWRRPPPVTRFRLASSTT